MAKLSNTPGNKEKEPYPDNKKEGKKEIREEEQQKIAKSAQNTK